MDIKEIMSKVEELHKKFIKLQEQISSKEVEASAGGGMVTAVANGAGQLVRIKIDPTVVDSKDIQMLQDLVVAAVNEALKKAKEMREEELANLTGGLKIPGMNLF